MGAHKPLERRHVALLTLIVIAGLVVTEIVSAANGVIGFGKALPSFVMQIILSALFSAAYIISGKRASS